MKILLRLILLFIGMLLGFSAKAQPLYADTVQTDSMIIIVTDSLTVDVPADSLFDDLYPDVPVAEPLLAEDTFSVPVFDAPQPRPSPTRTTSAEKPVNNTSHSLFDPQTYNNHCRKWHTEVSERNVGFTWSSPADFFGRFEYKTRSSSPPRGGYFFLQKMIYDTRRTLPNLRYRPTCSA